MSQQQLRPALLINHFDTIRIENKLNSNAAKLARQFQFGLCFDDDHDIFTLTYSGQPDISEAISEWLMDYDLDLHFLRPIRNFVECVSSAMFETSQHRLVTYGAGVQSAYDIPSIRLQRRPQQALFSNDASFTFQFVLGDDTDNIFELNCSNRDHIPDVVQEWLDDHELEQGFLKPVRNFVELAIEGVTENPRHEITILPRSHRWNVPSGKSPLPSCPWRSERALKDGTSFTLDLFCFPRPPRSTTVMRMISQDRFGDFNNSHFN